MMRLTVILALSGVGAGPVNPQSPSPFPREVVATVETRDPNGHNQALFSVPHVVSDDGRAVFAVAGGDLKRYVTGRVSREKQIVHMLFYEPRSNNGSRPDPSRPVYEFGQVGEPADVSNPAGDVLVSCPIWAASAQDVAVAHETIPSRFYVRRGQEFQPLSVTELRSGISRVRLDTSGDRNELYLSLNDPFRILAAAKDRHSEAYAALVRELHVDEEAGKERAMGDYFVLATNGAPNWISGRIPQAISNKIRHAPGYSGRMLYDSKAGVIIFSGAGEHLLVYDVRQRRVRELPFDGWDRAELSTGGLAWFGDDTILVGVLKLHTYGERQAIAFTKEGAADTMTYLSTIIPKLYKVNLTTGGWTYLESIALLGASANGDYLATSMPTGTTVEVVKPVRR